MRTFDRAKTKGVATGEDGDAPLTIVGCLPDAQIFANVWTQPSFSLVRFFRKERAGLYWLALLFCRRLAYLPSGTNEMLEALIGLVGTVIRAYNGYKLGERSQAEKRAAREEDLDLQRYAEIVRETADGRIAGPEIGSDHFKRMLRLQERGLLERLTDNNFCLPGAKSSRHYAEIQIASKTRIDVVDHRDVPYGVRPCSSFVRATTPFPLYCHEYRGAIRL